MKNRKDQKRINDRDAARARRRLAKKYLRERRIFLRPDQEKEFAQLIAPMGKGILSMAAALDDGGFKKAKRRVVNMRAHQSEFALVDELKIQTESRENKVPQTTDVV